ncbi:MAG: hypothetical protein F7B59_02465 [Desulfurococcales archaeon]|nr:hypothetical protein [Desulfurococcales archaeon]
MFTIGGLVLREENQTLTPYIVAYNRSVIDNEYANRFTVYNWTGNIISNYTQWYNMPVVTPLYYDTGKLRLPASGRVFCDGWCNYHSVYVVDSSTWEWSTINGLTGYPMFSAPYEASSLPNPEY